jgi:AraC family transcriptional regulator of adaptative response/methylated-DNA-[protein]-cysteine methyltransferase
LQTQQEDTGMQIEFAVSPQAAHMPASRSILASAASTRTMAPIDSGSSHGHKRAWQQVLARDPNADGRFVYAVRSTKIYCRPTCPSRRPARAHVAFFPTAIAAESAGYRACKRCRPDRPAAPGDPHAAIVAEAARRLATDSAEPVRLADLARELGIARLTLLRAFRRVFGVTPNEFVRAQRMDSFKKTLHPSANNNKSITDAIYTAGFGSSSRLYETSAPSLGMTPRTLRAGGAGAEIRYTTAASPFGRVLVAATDVGICAIAFGPSDTELVADLRARFPRAKLRAAKRADGWLRDAVAYIASQTTEHPLAAAFPLDLRATAFQHRVWKALQQIPRGKTCSYAEVARKLGRPKAVRAVGRAIASNPIAVVVPCHRVIGSDGSMTGYRWGIDRKQKLLTCEGALKQLSEGPRSGK